MEILALVASVVSVIIGGFAIWLSVTFYRLSNKISEDTKEAAKGISSSVTRLESLFDRLYSDTFSMMKDTVSDMRKHIWPEKDQSTEALTMIEARADEKIQELRSQISSELSSVMRQVGRTDNKISGVEERLAELVDRAIQQTRRVESEAQEEISMASVLRRVQRFIDRYGELPIGRLLMHPLIRERFPRGVISEALRLMQREGMISANGDLDDPETVITRRQSHPDEIQERPTKESSRRG